MADSIQESFDIDEEMGEIEGVTNTLYQLHQSKNAGDLITHNRFVREYYKDSNNNREVNFNFVRGKQYEENELKKYRDKKKVPLVYNQIKTSERTILGLWLQNRYDVEFAANSPQKDDMAQILQQLDAWEQDQQGDDMLDIELVRQAWAGGNSFQECYMHVQNKKRPYMRTTMQNPFAVYWDPESRILITREDAMFVDRVSMLSYYDIKAAFPERLKLIENTIGPRLDGDSSYETVDVAVDRDHEKDTSRNGHYTVVERFFKKPAVGYFADIEDIRVQIESDEIEEFKMNYPEVMIEEEEVEELWLAVVCEEISTTKYLYNDKYHCQPRDPRTNIIIWPILEMVAESLNGEPQGFIDHERDANKVVNQMMANILSSATHSAAGAMLIDPTAFVSDKEAKLAARHHSDSDRSFRVKQGRAGDAMAPVPRAGVNTDHQYALDYSLSFLKEITSTPPSLKGQSEGSGVSGVLNQQRIEQGFTQLQVLMKNYRLFLKQRAKLRYYYWREYYNFEMTFRIIDHDTSENIYTTINQMVPEVDAAGRYTGLLHKINNINAAIYDITIKESTKSPMYRDKQLKFITELTQTPFVQSDPGLAGALLEESMRLSDAPQATKEFLRKYSTLIQQGEINKRNTEQQINQLNAQGAQLDNMSKMQQVAQTEAEQTNVLPNGNI